MLRIRFTLKTPLALVTFLLCTTLVGCSKGPDVETSRRFQHAEELFSNAETPEQFANVAAAYQEIVDSGFRSGNVFYNLGNAWMQAGQTGRAIAGYRQAQRIIPRDPYLMANLQLALRQVSSAEDQRKSPLDYVFFWQQSFSTSEQAIALTAVLLSTLLMRIVSQLGFSRTLMSRLSVALSVVVLLLGISLFRQWQDSAASSHGVLIADTVGRKGGSVKHDPAFTTPLQDGTEFIVIGEQSDWLNVQIRNSGEAWIPYRSAVTY